MVSLKYLIAIPLLFLNVGGQNRPEPPIEIFTRSTLTTDLFDSFRDGFCTKCDSSTCDLNFAYTRQIPEIKFSPENISKNSYNISKVNIHV